MGREELDGDSAPDLRPVLHRIIDRILHVPREPPKCEHCHHVTQLKTQFGVAKWLIGLALGAILTVLVRDFISYAAQRVRIIPAPGSNAERTAIDRVER